MLKLIWYPDRYGLAPDAPDRDLFAYYHGGQIARVEDYGTFCQVLDYRKPMGERMRRFESVEAAERLVGESIPVTFQGESR